MLLSMQGINKDYPLGKEQVRVLKDITFSVEDGSYTAITGPSGSGKTTLMNLIGCLDIPTTGIYLLDGEDIGKCSDNRLAEIRSAKIGFVFQSFYLLPKLTALENVALPLLYSGIRKKERLERAAEALEGVGLSERMRHRPNQLSGGQQQRVAIARAMITKPRLLLADEPTGALDTAAGETIMELFDRVHAGGTTIVMITHEPSVAERAEQIYAIRDGILSGPGEVNHHEA